MSTARQSSGKQNLFLLMNWCNMLLHLILLRYVVTNFTLEWFIKVHIFWEGHKCLRNLHRRFVLCHTVQKLRVISNKSPRTFNSCLSLYVIDSYIKSLEWWNWTKKRNHVPQIFTYNFGGINEELKPSLWFFPTFKTSLH